MLADFHPFGIVLSALLFGALNSGSAVLQMMTGISKYLAQVMQFVIVLLLAARFTWNRRVTLHGLLPRPAGRRLSGT